MSIMLQHSHESTEEKKDVLPLQLGLVLPPVLEMLRDGAGEEVIRVLHGGVGADGDAALPPPGGAVDGEGLAVDVGAGLAEEEDGGVGDVADGAEAAGGDLPLESLLLPRSGAAEPGEALGALDAAGGDGVAGEAAGAVLDGDRGHEGVDGGLGGGDVGLQGHARVVERHGDEDDARRGAAEEVRRRGLDGVEGAQDVDLDDGLEGVGGHGLYGDDEVARRAGAVVGGRVGKRVF